MTIHSDIHHEMQTMKGGQAKYTTRVHDGVTGNHCCDGLPTWHTRLLRSGPPLAA
jgi:hypothetical protein